MMRHKQWQEICLETIQEPVVEIQRSSEFFFDQNIDFNFTRTNVALNS